MSAVLKDELFRVPAKEIKKKMLKNEISILQKKCKQNES